MTAPFQQRARVIENVRLARDTFRLRFAAAELAARIRPGQFVMIRLIPGSDPLLGRPFALYDTWSTEDGHQAGIDVVYLVVGKLTSRLATLGPGDQVELWGPLGNGFPEYQDVDHVGLVAGGIGQTPFLAHIRQLLGKQGYAGNPPCRQARRVTLYYGVRTADLAAGVEDFRAAGADVVLTSDDGSLGEPGRVTDALVCQPMPSVLVGCGPEPMLHALARLAAERGVPCQVSLETPMACGVGICFSCVVKVKTTSGWDYRRCCVEGPVFDASHVLWD